MNKKTMQYIWKGLAVFGALVAAAIVVRSQDAAKQSGASFTDVVANDLKNTIKTKYT